MREVFSTFGSDQTPLFSFSEPSENLFTERFDRFDDVLPSSNAVIAEQLHLLGSICAEPAWIARALELVGAVASGFVELPTSCYWAGVAQRLTQPFFEVVVAGSADEVAPAVDRLRRVIGSQGVVVPCRAASPTVPMTEGKWRTELRIYPCETGICRQPFDSLEAAIHFLEAALSSPRE